MAGAEEEEKEEAKDVTLIRSFPRKRETTAQREA
jgi:hypothetical protein